ncbi:MAG: DUF2786 domain-containing protein [Geovibrio sp.]|nr:DUF2786 domain-containing protein [Geovibrio sp.]
MKILEKVIKLLALSESTFSEEEADTARKMAAKLIAQHQILQAELRPGEEIICKTYTGKSLKLDRVELKILEVIGDHVGCAVYFSNGSYKYQRRPGYSIVGRKADIEIHEYLLMSLSRQIEVLAKKKEGRRRNYKLGLIEGVRFAFEEIAHDVLKYKQQEGLVLVDENEVRQKEAKAWYSKDRKIKTVGFSQVNDDDFLKGVEDARNISVFVPVEENQDKTLKLEGKVS